MYNIWCEGIKIKLLFVVLGLFFLVGDYYFHGLGVEFYFSILFFILMLYILLKSVIKYFSLKKNGKIIDNVSYQIISRGNEKMMVANYTNESGNNVQFYKRKEFGSAGKIINNIPEKGVTSVLVNPKKEKEYYVFYPTQK